MQNPIGLMTADEIAYAGGVFAQNAPSTYYYLNASSGSATGTNWWWTMSPYNFTGSGAVVFCVGGPSYPGYLHGCSADNPDTVRPVVSLKSCVLLSDAAGTNTDPFVVQKISNECANADN